MFSNFRTVGFYCQPSNQENESYLAQDTLNREPSVEPVPPPELMMWRETPAAHLSGGGQIAAAVRKAATDAGFAAKRGKRFLEFGCSNGRVIRHFADWAEAAEGWGVDINSEAVMWAQQHLSPPLDFAVCTISPHLFFEDRYFNFIFAISVFTHFDDLMMAWLLELRRVTKPGGYLLLTFHDEETFAWYKSNPGPFFTSCEQQPAFKKFLSGGHPYLWLKRGQFTCNCFFKREPLVKLLSRHFEVVHIAPSNCAGQSGYLLRKRGEDTRRLWHF